MSPLPCQGNPHCGYRTSNYSVKGQSASLTRKTHGNNCCNQCGHWRKDCPQLQQQRGPLDLAPCANRRDTGGGTIPRSEANDGRKGSDWWSDQSLRHTRAPVEQLSVAPDEPRGTLNVAGETIEIFLDVRATYSILTWFSGPLNMSSQTRLITAVDGYSNVKRFTTPTHYLVGGLVITHQFSLMPECPIHLLEWDLL